MSLFAPEEYASRLEGAAGDGLSADDARAYAGGARPLRDFLGDNEAEEARADSIRAQQQDRDDLEGLA